MPGRKFKLNVVGEPGFVRVFMNSMNLASTPGKKPALAGYCIQQRGFAGAVFAHEEGYA